MDDPTDGRGGNAPVQDTEYTPDADAPSLLLGQSPLRHHARRPALGQIDVLVDEYDKLVLGLLYPRVQPLGRSGTAAEDEEFVGARPTQAGRAPQIGFQLRLIVDACHER